ncbi:MAG: hypothetical protein V3S14_08005, partial [Anaerolineae bacterium]
GTTTVSTHERLHQLFQRSDLLVSGDSIAGLRTTDEVLNVLGGFCTSVHLTPSGYEVFWPDTPTEKQKLIWQQLQIPDPGTRVPDVRSASQEADLARNPLLFSSSKPANGYKGQFTAYPIIVAFYAR